MFKHLNPSELDDVEPIDISKDVAPELDPDYFPEDTDLDVVASFGHVIMHQMSNFVKIGMAPVPFFLLATTAMVGLAFVPMPPAQAVLKPVIGIASSAYDTAKRMVGFEVSEDEAVEATENGGLVAQRVNDKAEKRRHHSFVARHLYNVIGFDPDTAIALPDGQHVHATKAWMAKVPSAAGDMTVDGFKKMIDEKIAVDDERRSLDSYNYERAAALANAVAIEEMSSDWNTSAWNVRYLVAIDDSKILKDVTSYETVAAQGFWNNENAIERMKTTGVIAVDSDIGAWFAGAYINGVPSVTYFNGYTCNTIFGISYQEGCRPLSGLGDAELDYIKATLYGELTATNPDAVTADEGQEIEQKKWYLDFQLTTETSMPSQDFETLYSLVTANVETPGGFSWSSTAFMNGGNLSAAPLTGDAKGLLHDPRAIDAMSKGGVVATTSVPNRFVLAAYIDGRARIVVTTPGGQCVTVLGDSFGRCSYRDIGDQTNGEAKVEETIAETVKSLFDKTVVANAASLESYLWYLDAPIRGESVLDAEGHYEAFNAILRDVSGFGTTREALAKWTHSPKLASPPLLARPEGFFSKQENVDVLSKGGAIIIPENMESTYLTAVRVDGKLSLQIVEIDRRTRSFSCAVVFGENRQPVTECGTRDLAQYGDLIKSLFAKQ